MHNDIGFLDALIRPELELGCVLTIGNFDGVHVGHRSIIQSVVRDARTLGVPSAALTFEPHPATVFRHVPPESFRLSTPDEKETLLHEAGIKVVVTANFDPRFAQLSPRQFVEDLLIDRLGARKVHVGYDFNFGKNRTGSTATLDELTAARGVRTQVHAPVSLNDATVSSTRVRRALEAGDMHAVTRLLGRPFRLGGQTAPGAGRGKGLGIPTLNLYPIDRLLPPLGVYACRVTHAGRRYDAIANLGRRPTFDDGERVSFETMVLEPFEVEARGLHIDVDLVHFIRPERRFDGPYELKAQIDHDVAQAREVLSR